MASEVSSSQLISKFTNNFPFPIPLPKSGATVAVVTTRPISNSSDAGGLQARIVHLREVGFEINEKNQIKYEIKGEEIITPRAFHFFKYSIDLNVKSLNPFRSDDYGCFPHEVIWISQFSHYGQIAEIVRSSLRSVIPVSVLCDLTMEYYADFKYLMDLSDEENAELDTSMPSLTITEPESPVQTSELEEELELSATSSTSNDSLRVSPMPTDSARASPMSSESDK